MKLNKGFEFTLGSIKEVKLLNKLGNNISSKKTSVVFYNSGLDIRRNKNIMMIFLSKQKDGYVTYVCNGNLMIGEFKFYTNKEVDIINETWCLTEYEKPIMFNQWRMLFYKDSVINEFVCPLLTAEIRYNKSVSELESLKSQVELYKNNLIEIKNRF